MQNARKKTKTQETAASGSAELSRATLTSSKRRYMQLSFSDERDVLLFFFLFFILRRMGKNKALAHHTCTYFHTRRVSI